ncbi:MAG: hypothetical protein JWN23_457 [Rhodocyclales bacterium]|nr:hypothetical protein [Rhodocyclales bacterium]
MFKRFLMITLTYAFGVNYAFAHITLEQKSAEAGSDYTAVFRVPHGCEGSATTGITVFLPVGIDDARPVAKEGWSLSQKTEKLDKPYIAHGTAISERVVQVTWSGHLAGMEYAEFVVRTHLPDAPGKRAFRVLQQCEQGQNDWAAVPQEGQAKPSLPAPILEITPAAPRVQ